MKITKKQALTMSNVLFYFSNLNQEAYQNFDVEDLEEELEKFLTSNVPEEISDPDNELLQDDEDDGLEEEEDDEDDEEPTKNYWWKETSDKINNTKDQLKKFGPNFADLKRASEKNKFSSTKSQRSSKNKK